MVTIGRMGRQGDPIAPKQQVFNALGPVGNCPPASVPPTPTGVTPELPVSDVSKFRKVTGNTLEWVGKQLRRPKLNHTMKYGNARQRYLAAQDPYITKGVLRKAIDDPDQAVQRAALQNNRISPKLLKRAAKYGYAETAALAIHLLQSQTKKGGKNAQ